MLDLLNMRPSLTVGDVENRPAINSKFGGEFYGVSRIVRPAPFLKSLSNVQHVEFRYPFVNNPSFCLPAFLGLVAIIVCCCSKPEMAWINARGVIATVADAEAGRDWADMEH